MRERLTEEQVALGDVTDEEAEALSAATFGIQCLGGIGGWGGGGWYGQIALYSEEVYLDPRGKWDYPSLTMEQYDAAAVRSLMLEAGRRILQAQTIMNTYLTKFEDE